MNVHVHTVVQINVLIYTSYMYDIKYMIYDVYTCAHDLRIFFIKHTEVQVPLYTYY